jgi:hypothetical protein
MRAQRQYHSSTKILGRPTREALANSCTSLYQSYQKKTSHKGMHTRSMHGMGNHPHGVEKYHTLMCHIYDSADPVSWQMDRDHNTVHIQNALAGLSPNSQPLGPGPPLNTVIVVLLGVTASSKQTQRNSLSVPLYARTGM